MAAALWACEAIAEAAAMSAPAVTRVLILVFMRVPFSMLVGNDVSPLRAVKVSAPFRVRRDAFRMKSRLSPSREVA
jgi:hypothetical protein